MLSGKKILRAAAVIVIALGAGHAAETLRAPAPDREVNLDAVRKSATPAVSAGSAAPDAALPRSASLTAPDKAGLENLIGITPVAASIPQGKDDPCTPTLALGASPGAMITLSLSAPCNRSERVVVRHSGLSFSAETGPGGSLALNLPALRRDALVAVYLGESQAILGRTTVPDAARFTRLGLVWDAPAEVELRITEGDRVLVGASSLPDPDGSGVTALGQSSLRSAILSSVYSVPGADLGDARITAELRITPETCGRTLRLTTVLASAGKVAEVSHDVAVPLCGTSGDILVLKNLAPATKIAAPR